MKIRVIALSHTNHIGVIALRTLCKIAPFILSEYLTYSWLINNEKFNYNYQTIIATPTAIFSIAVFLLLHLYILITYGMAFFNPKKQALHDKIAKTVVIQVA